MPRIPLIVVWVAVMCGYLPWSMGYAFFNPIVIVGYGFFGLLIGAHVRDWRWAIAATLGTTWLAVLLVNLTSSVPFWVAPPWGVMAANGCLGAAGALMAQRLKVWVARAIFAGLGAFVIFNRYLPYEWKVWIGEHTTDEDLITFAVGCGILFVGTWRLRR